MSVVHQLSPGWLLDHLSFINKNNYLLCPHCTSRCSKHELTSIALDFPHVKPVPSCGSSESIAFDLTTKQENKDGGNCEKFKLKYVFRAELFDVSKPYITSAVDQECLPSNEKEDLMNSVRKEIPISSFRKKRKRCIDFNQGELDAMEYHTKVRELIITGSSQLIQEGLKSGFLHVFSENEDKCKKSITLPLDTCNLSELCEMAKHLLSPNETELATLKLMENNIAFTEQDLFSRVVENNSSFAKMITLMGQQYLLPPRSSFLLSDISCMHPLLNCRKTYDVIVIDPPWQNKSVKRSNRYNYLSYQQIKQLPISKLAASNCLIITWVTNRQKILHFVKEELYPSWSVAVVAEWHWVKITNSGEFVFPLDSLHKKPYEGLIIGRVQEKSASPLRNADIQVLSIPDHKLIVSVPCTLHSHKPPLAGP